jgi:hypothetical protein
MSNDQYREIQEAIAAADDALVHLREARRQLGKAGGWGIWDILGGGSLVGLIKHVKMGNAEREISEAKCALQRFSKELQDVDGYSSVHIGGLLTFCDFFFDGIVADLIVQSKISDAKKECDNAIANVERIRGELISRSQGM